MITYLLPYKITGAAFPRPPSTQIFASALIGGRVFVYTSFLKKKKHKKQPYKLRIRAATAI